MAYLKSYLDKGFAEKIPDKFIDKLKNKCSRHPNENLILHCQTCKILICGECIDSHGGHRFKSVKKLHREMLDALSDKANKVKERSTSLDHDVGEVQRRQRKLKADFFQAKKQFESLKECGQELINHGMTILSMGASKINEAEEVMKMSSSECESTIHQLEKSKIEIERAVSKTHNLYTTCVDPNVVSYGNSLAKTLDKLLHPSVNLSGIQASSTSKLEKHNNSHLLHKVRTLLSQIADITEEIKSGLSLPMSCYNLTFNDSDRGPDRPLGTSHIGTLAILNKKDLDVKQRSISCPVMKENLIVSQFQTGLDKIFQLAVIEGSEIIAVNGKYMRRYTMSGKLVYSVEAPLNRITVQGRYIIGTNSKENTLYEMDRDTGSRKSLTKLTFDKPYGVVMDSFGTLYITSWETETVYRKRVDDKLFHPFISHRLNKSVFLCSPGYICTTNDSCLIVSNTNGHNIQKFNLVGRLIWTYGTSGSGLEDLYFPHGVSADINGTIYCADYCNHRVVQISPKGTLLRIVAEERNGLRYPRTVSVSGTRLAVGEDQGKILVFRI